METQKSNKGVISVLIVIIVLLLCVIWYLLFGRNLLSAKTGDNSTPTTTTTTTTTTTKTESDNTNNKTISVKTYRFFGYEESKGPDMYTTLKLYSDNKYEFYVNSCSEIIKYTGNYVESETSITLNGKSNYTFIKKQNGNILDLSSANVDICHESGGDFALESYKLN